MIIRDYLLTGIVIATVLWWDTLHAQAALPPTNLFLGLLQTVSSFLHPPIRRPPTRRSSGRTLSTSTQTHSFLYISLFISRNFSFSLLFLKIIGSVSGSETHYIWPRMFRFFLLFSTTLIVSDFRRFAQYTYGIYLGLNGKPGSVIPTRASSSTSHSPTVSSSVWTAIVAPPTTLYSLHHIASRV